MRKLGSSRCFGVMRRWFHRPRSRPTTCFCVSWPSASGCSSSDQPRRKRRSVVAGRRERGLVGESANPRTPYSWCRRQSRSPYQRRWHLPSPGSGPGVDWAGLRCSGHLTTESVKNYIILALVVRQRTSTIGVWRSILGVVAAGLLPLHQVGILLHLAAIHYYVFVLPATVTKLPQKMFFIVNFCEYTLQTKNNYSLISKKN